MIKAVLFDLDGTLLDRNSSLIIYLHHQMSRCRDILGDTPLADYLAKVIELDAHGHCQKDVLFQQVEQYFALPEQSWELLLADFRCHFPDTCVPFPKMHQTLQQLQDTGLKFGLVTNGMDVSQNPKIDGLGIRAYFDAILISGAEGVRKPDPEIFHRALQRLDVLPEQTVFVGDNPTADIRASKAMGMKAVWMKDDYWSEPEEKDAVITQLCELPGIVAGFCNAKS